MVGSDKKTDLNLWFGYRIFSPKFLMKMRNLFEKIRIFLYELNTHLHLNRQCKAFKLMGTSKHLIFQNFMAEYLFVYLLFTQSSNGNVKAKF